MVPRMCVRTTTYSELEQRVSTVRGVCVRVCVCVAQAQSSHVCSRIGDCRANEYSASANAQLYAFLTRLRDAERIESRYTLP